MPDLSSNPVDSDGATIERLPVYGRSLLRIEVPVAVRLASKRQSVREITQLCPGTIIGFDKTCDEMLELVAGGRTIATGEAIKVGDRFGLRINAMRLPEERFNTVMPHRGDEASDA